MEKKCIDCRYCNFNDATNCKIYGNTVTDANQCQNYKETVTDKSISNKKALLEYEDLYSEMFGENYGNH